ncbi:MAG TPA: response regulator [Ramlibacter sp.]|uniref:response regulator n=1 Tax=Ramlibacter sp. TaxID=1917967 RepID=UPI002BAD4013|nr:response regulator [Ramlibacter sp.]HVZ45714.1 response regulator [Ramlibacter sp.]
MAKRTKVLLIDDDAVVLRYLGSKLGTRYEVLTVQEPHAGVALARAQQPDVIVCDIDMPAMSGGDVAAALAADALTRKIPVVYLSALVSPEETRDLQGVVGGRRGVSKRARLAELVAVIEQATATA